MLDFISDGLFGRTFKIDNIQDINIKAVGRATAMAAKIAIIPYCLKYSSSIFTLVMGCFSDTLEIIYDFTYKYTQLNTANIAYLSFFRQVKTDF